MCEENGYLSSQKSKYCGLFSEKTIKLIEKRRKLFLGYQNGKCDLESYTAAKRDALDSRREDYKKKSIRETKKACKFYLENNPRYLWRWLKYQTRRFNSSIIDGPIFDSHRNIVTDKLEKEKIWADYFEDMAKDVSGNSRGSEKWRKIEQIQIKYYEECDRNITWVDIQRAIKATPNNKSPGIDGIPSELWKLVQEEKTPESHLSKLLVELILKMWNSAHIPKIFNTSIIVPIPKKGDLRDTNNYRGISLIPTLVKILAKIVAQKLNELDSKYNLLVKEQAGFRSREECVSQATVLYEVVRRRKIKGIPTWIGFIDFAKAYDRVPHETL
ncbi:Transposon TX1 uncharacterized [Smittium culicis]|uniref:Transposon TX1 uncharacterized n=1 Tax=Smittium culicis TaxID=133412 RepID=A0A1R1XL00_9FUNG|nr:Transposon TX1 uncharacterized [Smittium culicis]